MSDSYMVTFEIITGVNVSVMSVLVFHIDLRVQQQNPQIKCFFYFLLRWVMETQTIIVGNVQRT
jgi:hypothetical protein